jgi:hypothetical protein
MSALTPYAYTKKPHVWFILISSWVHSNFTFFLNLGRGHILIDWPITNFFGTIGHSPIDAPLWTPSHKNKNKCAALWPTFSFYIHESWTLGKPYGIKLRCHWEQLENLGILMWTWWEHIGNEKKEAKKSPSSSSSSSPFDALGPHFGKSLLIGPQPTHKELAENLWCTWRAPYPVEFLLGKRPGRDWAFGPLFTPYPLFEWGSKVRKFY